MILHRDAYPKPDGRRGRRGADARGCFYPDCACSELVELAA